ALKVKDGSLLAADFKAGQLPGGAQGPKGDRGPAGISGLEIVLGATETVAPGQDGGAVAHCPAGKKVVGGGGGSESEITIFNSGPSTNAQWGINARNPTAS